MLARRMDRVTASAIMELIKTTAKGNYISFASGLPDPTLFPVDTIREITEDVLLRDGTAALQYGPAEGHPPLREYVAQLLRTRGLNAAPENILITTGSQQALDLAARALLDPGDRVVIESPSYLAAIQAFDSYEAGYLTAPIESDGVSPCAVTRALSVGARLVYTLPNFQNPTGLSASLERRQAVAEATAAAGVALLEDDAYYDLRYEGSPLPPLAALAPNPGAIYTGTFSKTVAPGLRVGYLCAERSLVERLGQLKQITDLHAGSLSQRIVLEYCRRGHLSPGIEQFRKRYRRRRDVMLGALAEEASDLITWTRPQGGMFIFATLPEGRDANELLQKAMARGVVFVPGAGFFVDGRGKNTFRLNFVSADESRIREGVGILVRTIRDWLT